MTFLIHDSDRHVIEPLAMWQDYVDKAIMERVQLELVALDSPGIKLSPELRIKGKPVLKNWTMPMKVAAAHKKLNSVPQMHLGTRPEFQTVAMDEEQIASANMFPTFAAFIVNNENLSAEESLAFAQAYNRWLSDYCAEDPSRLHGVGLVSRHDPSNLLEQLEAIYELGFRTITMRAEIILGRTLGDPAYDEFWQQCEQRSIGIAFHGGTHLQAETVGHDRFNTHFGLHACAHSMELQMAFVSLLEAGVLERHPSLKFAFLEGGASWVPHWLWRLDEICYTDLPKEIESNIRMKPSEYFKRQCWVALEIGEPCLREVVNSIGIKRIIYGTDFPHPDHVQFDIKDISEACGELDDDELQKILADNAFEFFGHKPPEHSTQH
ncbi:MAG: hypothetical protein COA42_06850 [Alteromonadaceae bacterium]|nr:MAG: hypothetical protein COA42_06850 [Alteromonadaceae bacterium]